MAAPEYMQIYTGLFLYEDSDFVLESQVVQRKCRICVYGDMSFGIG